MAQILDKTRFPLDTVVTKEDYLIGTDIDDNLKTKNFNIGSIIRLFNSEVNFSAAEYKFSDGTDPDVTYDTQGFLFSNSPTGAPSDTTKIFINSATVGGTDLSDLYTLLGANAFSFSLKLINSSDPSDSFFFKVQTVTAHVGYFEIDVQVIGAGYVRNFTNLTTYNIYLEVLGAQDNKTIVKDVNVTGDITTAKTVSAINALTGFTVAEDQSVLYNVVSDNGTDATFVPINLGKGSYGVGGTQLSVGDVYPISTSGVTSGGGSAQIVNATLAVPYTEVDAVAAINALSSFEVTGIPFFYVTAPNGEVHIHVGAGLTAGSYGIGGTQLDVSDVERIAVVGNTNIIKYVPVVDELTDLALAASINALPQFEVQDQQNVYFRAVPDNGASGLTYIFILKNKSNGLYGTGGTQIAAGDLQLISVNSGKTSWKLKVGGVDKLDVNLGDSVDFKQGGYAVVQYSTGGVVTISTSQALSDLLAKFKPIEVVTKTQYQTMKDAGTLVPGTVYAQTCS